MDLPNVVQLENLEKSYRLGKITVPALRGVSLSLHQGEFTVVMGPSGSGKTTLLNIIGTLDKPTSGRALIDGEDIARMSDGQLTKLRRHKIGFVFQFHNLIPVLSALENVQLPLLTAGVKRGQAEERANELLARVGLKDRTQHLPDELSGGEQQRVAIARALANHPRIVLADEPTGDLDTHTGSEVVKIMHSLTKQEQTAVVVVTHDPIIAEKADRLVEMRDGRITEQSTRPVARETHTIRAVEPVPPEPGRSVSQPN
ncbi:MAG TPA: ABC transporter ATP-binding protein [Candidatus Bathyarchaeia archaeon]|nr:ABC transporter ATP-binding protein [Candidatus Bathyarchaeia archaeon]